MLNQLSKNEKTIIIVFLTIVIWAAGIMLIIKPNFAKMDMVKEQEKTAEFQKEQVDNKIATEPVLKENIEKSRKELSDNLSKFFDATANYDVDQYITQHIVKSGVSVASMIIADPTVESLDYYNYQFYPLTYPLGDYAKSLDGIEVKTEDEQNAENTDEAATMNEACEVTEVTISVKGTLNQVKEFINSISHDEKTMLVVTTSMNNDKTTGTWDASIGIKFIAVDKHE